MARSISSRKGRSVRPLTSACVLAALVAAPASALAVPAFCPSGPPVVCPGGQSEVGDVLVTMGGPFSAAPPLVVGFHPSTSTFYVFSTSLVVPSNAVADIAVEPGNPTRTVIDVGDLDQPNAANRGFAGVIELDNCGNIVVPASAPIWGQFGGASGPPLQLPVLQNPGLDSGNSANNLDIVFSAATGELLSPGTPLPFQDGTTGQPIYAFAPGGGQAAVIEGPAAGDASGVVNNGVVASDEFGNLYESGSGSPESLFKYSGTSLVSPPAALTVLDTGVTDAIDGLVYAGNHTLFATTRTAVFKIDSISGATTAWVSGLANAAQLTIDNNGNLWIAEGPGSGNSTLVEVNSTGTTGAIQHSFAIPVVLGGQTSEDAFGVAIYGENLPAITIACAPPLFPTLGNALQATTGPASINPPTLIDSYKSCNGSYGGSNVTSDGNVQAGKAITANRGAIIHGSLIPNTPVTSAPFPVPAGLVSLGDMNTNRAVTLTAGDYLFGNININNGGSIVGTGGRVRIWYTGSLNIGGPVTAANNLPGNLWFFGEAGSGSANVNASVNVTGVIYSPTAQSVSVNPPNAQVFGALIGGAQATANAGSIHFDQVLAGATCP